MSAQTSFAWCSDCGYIGPDFKTGEYLPYVDEGRAMPGGKTYECPKCGLTIGEQVIQEHFESLESEVKRLTDLNSGLSELTQGMDYCAEESEKKRKDAESRLAQAQEWVATRRKNRDDIWFYLGELEKTLGVEGVASQ